MQAPDSIERALSRLMPVGLSETGQQSIEEMLDRLIGEEPVSKSRHQTIKIIALIGSLGIAAAAVLMISTPVSTLAIFSEKPKEVTKQQLSLVGETGRVENMTDEGWVSDLDGGTMEAVRFRVVEENTLRDEETGIVVQVSEPREELLLFPVTAF